MPLIVVCPHCGKNLNAPEEMRGQSGRCPSCNHVFDLVGDDGLATGAQVRADSITAVPPTPGLSVLEDAARPANEFAGFRTSGQAVYTAPRTFNRLYACLFFLTVLKFLPVAAIALLELDVSQRGLGTVPGRPQRVVSSVSVEFGGRTIYWDTLAPEERLLLASAMGLFLLSTVARLIVFFVLLYRCWALIQDGYPQTTPGKAVGFWFIPVFNLYWVFVAVRGLAEDLNRYASRRRLRAREVNVAVATVYAIVLMLQLIPCWFGPMPSQLGYLSIVSMLLGLIVMYQIKNTAGGIAAARNG